MNDGLHNNNNNITASNNNINKWEMIIKAHNKEQQLIEKLNHVQNHNNQHIQHYTESHSHQSWYLVSHQLVEGILYLL